MCSDKFLSQCVGKSNEFPALISVSYYISKTMMYSIRVEIKGFLLVKGSEQ